MIFLGCLGFNHHPVPNRRPPSLSTLSASFEKELRLVHLCLKRQPPGTRHAHRSKGEGSPRRPLTPKPAPATRRIPQPGCYVRDPERPLRGTKENPFFFCSPLKVFWSSAGQMWKPLGWGGGREDGWSAQAPHALRSCSFSLPIQSS